MSIGTRIRETRRHHKVDVADIARAAGVSKQAVYQWENGETKTLKGDNLLAVARALGVDATWLSTGKGPMTAEEPAPDYAKPISGEAFDVAVAYMKLSPALQSSVRTIIFSMASAHSIAKWLKIEAPKSDGYGAWECAVQAAYDVEIKQLKLDLDK